MEWSNVAPDSRFVLSQLCYTCDRAAQSGELAQAEGILTMQISKIVAAGLTATCVVAGPVAASASGFKTLYTFTGNNDGAAANAIVYHAGKIYGTGFGGESGDGNVFALNPSTGKLKVIFNFTSPTTGQYPGPIVYGGGMLYGVTGVGPGACSCGAIFRLDPTSGAESVLYSFTGGSNGTNPENLIYQKGNLLGSTEDLAGSFTVIFEFNLLSSDYSILHVYSKGFRRELSANTLIPFGRNQYGISDGNGFKGNGIIFSLHDKGDKYQKEYLFQGGDDGNFPDGLVLQGNMLYGTTIEGGTAGGGTIYAFDPQAKTKTVLYNFQGGTDGSGPGGSMLYINGYFYGFTGNGGDLDGCGGNGCGTVFQYDPATGTHTVLYSFTGNTDGSEPLNMISDGTNLYGVTRFGYGSSTIFEYQP
jgi:uncharacterized repeat protein (TIGR03803 family)